jgi:hypothetical protein
MEQSKKIIFKTSKYNSIHKDWFVYTIVDLKITNLKTLNIQFIQWGNEW